MKFLATVFDAFRVRASVSLLVPVVLAGFLFLADSYLKSDARSRVIWGLMESGADISIDEAVKAAGAGRLYCLDMLQVAGVDLGQMGSSGYTPLIASLRGDTRLVADYLIQDFEVERTLHIKSKDTGITAFEEAARSGRFLFANEIHRIANELNGDRYPGLNEILAMDSKISGGDLFSSLRRLGVDSDEAVGRWGKNLPLVIAVERQDGARIRQLINSGADVQITGTDGNSLLVGAILKGDHDLVIQLIKAGAQVNPVTSANSRVPEKATPLECSIQHGDLRLVELILYYGANPNGIQSTGFSPLAFAIQNRDASLAAVLIAAGVDFTDPDFSFSTLFNDDKTSLELLLKSGVSPDQKNLDGVRLLDQALILGLLECADILIGSGADITNSLAFALHSDSPDLVDFLLRKGANIDELGGEEGSALLDYAFKTDNMRLVAILLKHGASLDSVSRAGGVLLVVPEKSDQSVSLEIETKSRKIVLDSLR